MYKSHPKLTSPSNPKEKIWRYMDFTKFVSLLSKQSLFFCRVDKLDDQNEMTMPIANKKKHIEFYENNKEQIKKDFNKLPLEVWASLWDITRHSIIINSWNRSEYESASMWSTYLVSNQGIAIQSSFNLLSESFHKTSDEINIGIVKYKDYKTEIIEDDTIFGLVTNKLQSYEHERELRVMIINQSGKDGMPLHDIGKYVPIDINVLIESIYIAPNAPKWFNELVIEVIKHFGFNFPIKTSELNDRSLY